MKKKSELPFKNRLLQDIMPGDEVIAVSTSRHKTYVKRGIFHGLTKIGNPQVRVQEERWFWSRPDGIDYERKTVETIRTYPNRNIFKFVP